jgi:hypothetical protein
MEITKKPPEKKIWCHHYNIDAIIIVLYYWLNIKQPCIRRTLVREIFGLKRRPFSALNMPFRIKIFLSG